MPVFAHVNDLAAARRLDRADRGGERSATERREAIAKLVVKRPPTFTQAPETGSTTPRSSGRPARRRAGRPGSSGDLKLNVAASGRSVSSTARTRARSRCRAARGAGGAGTSPSVSVSVLWLTPLASRLTDASSPAGAERRDARSSATPTASGTSSGRRRRRAAGLRTRRADCQSWPEKCPIRSAAPGICSRSA